MLSALLLAAALASQAQPLPSLSDRATAAKKVDEVFDDQISAAKTAEAKAGLARELAKAAEGEPDIAAKYVLLDRARDLAKGGGDMGQAVEITRSLVRSFAAPTDVPEDKWIERGNAAWKAAGNNADRRLTAIEWYLRAEPTATGLDKATIAKRIDEMTAGKVVDLLKKIVPARDYTWDYVNAQKDRPHVILPYAPPRDYTLVVEGECGERPGELIVGFVMDGKQGMFLCGGKSMGFLESSGNQEYSGRGHFHHGSPPRFEPKEQFSLALTVHSGSVKAIFNGNEIAYEGDGKTLGVDSQAGVPAKDRMFISGGLFKFTKITVQPIGSQAK